MREQHYPARTSKAGIYVTGLLILVPLLLSIAFLGLSEPFPAIVLIGALFAAIVLYASAFKVRYELDEKELRFRQGIFSAWRIPLQSITRVLPARGQAGISFTSTDCLLVEAGRRIRLVAAPDPDKFLEELAARAPHLRRYGRELRGTV